MNDRPKPLPLDLPARLDVEQTAKVLGFVPYEIPLLVRAKLLKPLGKPAPNGHKWFATVEIQELAFDREWLDKATRIIAQHFQQRNGKAQNRHAHFLA
jgi:hypothetical protein